jgi:glutathionyl-hydroquinone reductase
METAGSGAFVRQANRFTDRITADGSSGYPAEAGRYRLVVSLACPWAHRALIVRGLLGLEDAISLAVVDPLRDDKGCVSRSTTATSIPYWARTTSRRATSRPTRRSKAG